MARVAVPARCSTTLRRSTYLAIRVVWSPMPAKKHLSEDQWQAVVSTEIDRSEDRKREVVRWIALSIGFTTAALFTIWGWWAHLGGAQLYVFWLSSVIALNLLLAVWELFLAAIARTTSKLLTQASRVPSGEDLEVVALLNLVYRLRSSLLLIGAAALLGVTFLVYGLYLGLYEWFFAAFLLPFFIQCAGALAGLFLGSRFLRVSREMTWSGMRERREALGEDYAAYLTRLTKYAKFVARRVRVGFPVFLGMQAGGYIFLAIVAARLVPEFIGITILLMVALLPVVWAAYFGWPMARYHSERLMSFDRLHKGIVLGEFDDAAAIATEFSNRLVYSNAFDEPSFMNLITEPTSSASTEPSR